MARRTNARRKRGRLEQAVRYVAAQKAAVGFVPTRWKILFERFFDESGGMQVVIHAPLGARVTRAWGLAMRKRFCRSFDFELQASADDDGFVLAIGPQHSFPIDALFKMLNRGNGEHLLTQALLAAPMFETRWRWNSTRVAGRAADEGRQESSAAHAAVQGRRFARGRLPGEDRLLREPSRRHRDSRSSARPADDPRLPHRGDGPHALARDARRLSSTARSSSLRSIRASRRRLSHELVNANPYAFLDDAPLEERRARAVATRRGLTIDAVRDLGRLGTGGHRAGAQRSLADRFATPTNCTTCC